MDIGQLQCAVESNAIESLHYAALWDVKSVCQTGRNKLIGLKKMKIMAVDFGDARTGLAMCDRTEFLASPLGMIQEKSLP